MLGEDCLVVEESFAEARETSQGGLADERQAYQGSVLGVLKT